MATNNPYALNNAFNTAVQSSPSLQNLMYGNTPSNGMGALGGMAGGLGGMFGANGGLGGGMASAPRNLTPAAPLDQNFYNSQIYKDFQNDPANMMAGSAMTYSPYFGQQTSDDGGRQDRAYEQYLASIGQPVNNQNTAPAPTAGMSNQSNFNFTPTAIGGSGSYNTADYASLFGGLATGGVAGAAAGAGVNDAIGRLQALGQAGVTDYGNLAKTATQGINFTPYALTSSLGTTQQTAPGVISQQLTPQQQANVNAAQSQQGSLYGAAVPDTSGIAQGAFGQSQAQLAGVGAGQQDLASLRAGYGTAAQGMTGMLGGSTTDMANQLFQQQQGMRNPEQQRQQQALESRLLSQGRLGTTTAAYGGTPEQLAMAKAIQEQQSADAFNSMTQAEQMAASQQARALGLGNATSSMAQAQQALRQGDIANAQGLFNIGATAAQLPQQMQGQNIAQAGQLQAQALAPGAQQLQQAQLSANIGQQQADTAYKAGGLFGGLAGAGLQERLTAESAASATRVKQFDSILKSYSAQGGTTGADANSIQGLINQGVTKAGNMLYSAAGKLIGPAIDVIGATATDMWDSLMGSGDISMGGDAGLGGPSGGAAGIIDDIGGAIGDTVSGGIDAIKGAYDYFFGN